MLRSILSSLRRKISGIVGNEISSANEQQGLGYAVLILVILISPCIIFLVRNATLTIQIFSLNLAKKAHELKVEKKKADKLLFQMLPPTVAISLQQRKHVTAETFESVTVYFSDIADFLSLGLSGQSVFSALILTVVVVVFLNLSPLNTNNKKNGY